VGHARDRDAAGVLLLCRVPCAWAQEEEGEEGDPPQVAVGERLFLETRFSQFFFARSGGNANAVLPAGDPNEDYE
jgi:hypothetical protein